MEQEQQDATLVKGGEQKIQVMLRRGAGGLNLTVKTAPEVEEFFRSTVGAEGATSPVTAHGRFWYPIGREVLSVYAVQNPVRDLRIEDGGTTVHVGFNNAGRPLIEGYSGEEDGPTIGRRSQILNLSFLRLVGISEGTGVSFGVKGVFTTNDVLHLRNLIGEANKKFYSAYLRKIGLVVTTSIQEL